MANRQQFNSIPEHFGFSVERGGAHSSRTIMVEELGSLFLYVNQTDAIKSDYFRAIDEDNCLNKRSGKTRILTYRHLVDLYALDPSFIIFRGLLYYWNRDEEGRPMLALLCAYARDSILRSAAPFVLQYKPGEIIKREDMEAHIDHIEPNRFSPATLKSTAQNINSSMTKSGHLSGRAVKTRTQAKPTTGSLSYALLLGYLSGARGRSIFQTEYVNLLECPYDQAVEMAQDASRRGWLVFKHVGDVVEVLFPNLVNDQEKEWLREQG